MEGLWKSRLVEMIEQQNVAAALIHLRIQQVTPIRRHGKRGIGNRQRLVHFGDLADSFAGEIVEVNPGRAAGVWLSSPGSFEARR